MVIATGIVTENWNECIRILLKDGWTKTFSYDNFDVGIDFDFIRLEKGNEKILLAWDNWFEGEIKCKPEHLEFLTNQTGFKFDFAEPENLTPDIISLYDRPRVGIFARLLKFLKRTK